MKLSWKELSIAPNRMILLCFLFCAEAALAKIIPHWSGTLFTQCASLRVLRRVSDIARNSPSSFSVHFLSQKEKERSGALHHAERWSSPPQGCGGISKHSATLSLVFILGRMSVGLSARNCNVFFNYDRQSAVREGIARNVTGLWRRLRDGSSTDIRELQESWTKSLANLYIHRDPKEYLDSETLHCKI